MCPQLLLGSVSIVVDTVTVGCYSFYMDNATRTLTYWCCASLAGDWQDKIRCRTRKEASAVRDTMPGQYGAPVKVVVEYNDVLVKARCTPDEKAEIVERARRAGVTMSEYLLRCALPAKKPRTP